MDDRRADKSVSIWHPRVDLEGNGPDGLTTPRRRSEGAKVRDRKQPPPDSLSTLEKFDPKVILNSCPSPRRSLTDTVVE